MTDVCGVMTDLARLLEEWIVALGGPEALGGPVALIENHPQARWLVDAEGNRLAGYEWRYDLENYSIVYDLYPPRGLYWDAVAVCKHFGYNARIEL